MYVTLLVRKQNRDTTTKPQGNTTTCKVMVPFQRQDRVTPIKPPVTLLPSVHDHDTPASSLFVRLQVTLTLMIR